jgi:competence protein ComEA
MPRRIVTFTLLAALAAAPALAAVVTESVSANAAAVGDKHDKININTASARELQKLDGVGHTMAERIVHYREEHGPFKRGEDLKKVEGVGAALWERNRERIVVK